MTQKADPINSSPDVAGPAHAWHMVLGLALWFVWFIATYGGVAVACAMAPPPPASGSLNWLNISVLLLAAATTAAFVTAAWVSALGARRRPAGIANARRRFIAGASAALYIIAAVSTAVVALPAVLLAPCV